MSSSLKQMKAAEGFTLLEVMIAMAVMALGIVPLLVTHGASVRNMTRSKEMTHAALMAAGQISILEARGFEALEMDLDLPPAEDDASAIPYLSLREELEEVEPGQLLEARVKVSIKNSESDPIEIVGYIVNPSFKEEEEEETEE